MTSIKAESFATISLLLELVSFLTGLLVFLGCAVTIVYRATRNLFLAQRFARHASPLTTIVYTHPADEELYEGDLTPDYGPGITGLRPLH